MRMRCAVVMFALLLGSIPAGAQTRAITGTVTDAATGQPLEGARVGARSGADTGLHLINAAPAPATAD